MKINNTFPIVDCTNFNENLEEISKIMGRGFEEFGFVYLTNHGFAKETIDHLNEKMLEFYKLPDDVKIKYKMGKWQTNYFGYTPAGSERVGDLGSNKAIDTKEAFDFSSPDADDLSKYPIEVIGLKDAMDNFRSHFKNVSQNLLRAFAIYLGLDQESFIPNHSFDYSNGCYSKIRNIYYPATEGCTESVRLGEHRDLGVFTYLFQDTVGGLERETETGNWIPITPIPGSIVLITGQTLESWSGGKFKAVHHRVRADISNIGKMRQTLVFFLLADRHVPLTPMVPQLQPDWTPPYLEESETCREFIHRRLAGLQLYN